MSGVSNPPSQAAPSGPTAGISSSVTMPANLNFHMVQDYELDKLAASSTPTAFGFATFVGGAVLGYVPQMLELKEKFDNQMPIAGREWALALLAAFGLGISIICGISAFLSWSSSADIIAEIRKRPKGPGPAVGKA